MRWIVALTLLCGGVLAGCGGGHERQDTRDEIPMSMAGEAMDAKYNQDDPVCGMRVNTRSAAATERYGGKTWFFDTQECWQKFHDNPTAYTPGHEEAFAHLDPVCGKQMDRTTAFYREEYGGRMYYFDSKDCWQKFHDNPHAYMPGGDDRPQREVK